MNKFMRIIVFFDLPVGTKKERREATQFRNFLLKDGFYMMQFSVYSRIVNGTDALEKHYRRIDANNPETGSVRVLTVTEQQFSKMKIILGNTTYNDKPQQLEIPLIF
ncbi:MAG: CRISPR-associated endonuclease Cas2 [Firmicutes bacterium]|nr:CRISPR-associated endonuclease Cas2 [Bacillota bacterium]